MISTSPKRLRTTAWTINKNKKVAKGRRGKGRNFSASAFSNEGALICSGREHMAQKRRGKTTRKQRQRQLHRRMFLGGFGGADLRRHLQRHPPCGKNGK